MTDEAMRRYVRRTLEDWAARERWDALRLVGEQASGLGPTGPAALALRACRAVGGSGWEAHPAAASLHCLHMSIHLVDDIIDGEERPFLPLPPGLRANVAMALQSLAVEVLEAAPEPLRAPLMLAAAATGRETARGQELDAAGAADEEAYWRIVEAKTPPLFAAALRMGALLAGAPPETAARLGEVGTPLGVLVQLGDDLGDVMGDASHPDWGRPGDNIVLRFAAQADHPERDAFLRLLPRVAEPGAHDEAAEILVRSGAMSFCVHHMLTAAADARRRIDTMGLADPAPLLEVVEMLIAPAIEMLSGLGPVPDDDLAVEADAWARQPSAAIA
jgi:geranylgeranyl pyrophosphate synthase